HCYVYGDEKLLELCPWEVTVERHAGLDSELRTEDGEGVELALQALADDVELHRNSPAVQPRRRADDQVDAFGSPVDHAEGSDVDGVVVEVERIASGGPNIRRDRSPRQVVRHERNDGGPNAGLEEDAVCELAAVNDQPGCLPRDDPVPDGGKVVEVRQELDHEGRRGVRGVGRYVPRRPLLATVEQVGLDHAAVVCDAGTAVRPHQVEDR